MSSYAHNLPAKLAVFAIVIFVGRGIERGMRECDCDVHCHVERAIYRSDFFFSNVRVDEFARNFAVGRALEIPSGCFRQLDFL